MDSKNIGWEKSKMFAVRIINLYKHLINDKKEFVLGRQILKSGTSIGANLSEARCAISKKDFRLKVYISRKECSETRYWLELLYETDFLTKSEFESMVNDCDDILKILTATTKTLEREMRDKS